MDDMTLRQIRRAKEISAESIANFLGIHQNTYLLWEKEPSKIRIDMAYKICEFLGVKYSESIFLP